MTKHTLQIRAKCWVFVVVGVIAVLIVTQLIDNQNIFFKIVTGTYNVKISNGTRNSIVYNFNHYSYDFPRAINWLKANGTLTQPANPLVILRSLPHVHCGSGKFSPFVKAAMSYLSMCRFKRPARVGIFINMRHRLKDTNAPGNYLRIAMFLFDPNAKLNTNAMSLKQCISDSKRNHVRRQNNFQFLWTGAKCDVILNTWTVKDESWFVVPISPKLCSSPIFDGRSRFVNLSDIHGSWYVYSEQYIFT